MQYVLSQQEFDALKAKQNLERLANTKKMQALCTKIANEMPVRWGWSKNVAEDTKPWGCHLSKDGDDEWYCDKCPVQEICPSDQHWSQ